jgi:hypothetical protein
LTNRGFLVCSYFDDVVAEVVEKPVSEQTPKKAIPAHAINPLPAKKALTAVQLALFGQVWRPRPDGTNRVYPGEWLMLGKAGGHLCVSIIWEPDASTETLEVMGFTDKYASDPIKFTAWADFCGYQDLANAKRTR